MIIELHASFRKSYSKRIARDAVLIKKVDQRMRLFQDNPMHPILRNHPLSGTRHGQRAFWVTGDIRIIYFLVSEQHALFIDIGSHNQVY